MYVRPFRILVVDDDDDDRLLISEALMECGVDLEHVTFAKDGEQAMALLQDGLGVPYRLPSLVLLDWNMPKMGGRDVLKVLQESTTLNTLPVVVLTTSSREEDIRETYALGGRSFIIKPTSFDGLVNVVRRMKDYWQHTVALP